MISGRDKARRALALAGLGLALTLAGCGTKGPLPSPSSPTSQPAQTAADPWTRPLVDFERRQRAAAEAAAAQGRWAEALAAWDVLVALHPDDLAMATRRTQAGASAVAAAADRLQRARQAQQRGDGETAARAYLDVLAIQPGQPEASEALRAMERDRVRRQHLGKLSRYALASKPTSASPANPFPSASQQNEIEHASLLAEQGEIDSAIALLKPLADKSGADSAPRRLLAEIHFRQGEALAGSDKAAAIAALERCLQALPTHTRAATLLKELRERTARPP